MLWWWLRGRKKDLDGLEGLQRIRNAAVERQRLSAWIEDEGEAQEQGKRPACSEQGVVVTRASGLGRAGSLGGPLGFKNSPRARIKSAAKGTPKGLGRPIEPNPGGSTNQVRRCRNTTHVSTPALRLRAPTTLSPYHPATPSSCILHPASCISRPATCNLQPAHRPRAIPSTARFCFRKRSVVCTTSNIDRRDRLILTSFRNPSIFVTSANCYQASLCGAGLF